MNTKACTLLDNFIILHLINYRKKDDPLAKLISGCFGLFYFLYVFIVHERTGFADTLVFCLSSIQRVFKSSVLLFCIIIIFFVWMYVYLVIDCPRQKGKDVAIVA